VTRKPPEAQTTQTKSRSVGQNKQAKQKQRQRLDDKLVAGHCPKSGVDPRPGWTRVLCQNCSCTA